uniref:Uncharacterized protein n=1 Tax=Arundo donax TaxID=35708 RepID=A0A0A9FXV9_ARUDO
MPVRSESVGLPSRRFFIYAQTQTKRISILISMCISPLTITFYVLFFDIMKI